MCLGRVFVPEGFERSRQLGQALEYLPLNIPRSHRIFRQLHHHNVCGGLDGAEVMLAVCALLTIIASIVLGQDLGLGLGTLKFADKKSTPFHASGPRDMDFESFRNFLFPQPPSSSSLLPASRRPSLNQRV